MWDVWGTRPKKATWGSRMHSVIFREVGSGLGSGDRFSAKETPVNGDCQVKEKQHGDCGTELEKGKRIYEEGVGKIRERRSGVDYS